MRRTAGMMVLLVALGGSGRAGAGEEPAVWEPAKTWALFVGILEWEKPGLASFPKKGRVDRVLEKALVARGVPAGHVTFLEDRAATLAACREALAAVAAAAGEGSTLIVYYAGHGMQADGQTWFTPFDTDPEEPAKTALSVREIGRTLKQRWKGSRLLLLADCCYSGALGQIVKGYEGADGVKAACLTSALASNLSTGAWTYSEALVSILGGDGVADANGDDRIDFAEADAHVRREMRYRESQLTEARRTTSFEPTFSLATVDPARRRAKAAGAWQPRDYAEAEWEGTWWRVQILEAAAGRLRVHYLGHPDSSDEWVAPARLRRVPPLAYEKGAPVSVEWKGTWWPARVVEVRDEFAYVHYDGFGAEWDEWVTAKRLRART